MRGVLLVSVVAAVSRPLLCRGICVNMSREGSKVRRSKAITLNYRPTAGVFKHASKFRYPLESSALCLHMGLHMGSIRVSIWVALKETKRVPYGVL